ncbi:MAG: RidA family protein, partial [Phycisphaerae bacterium]|nr:RidA family protein [Phycisphaerae bacterium]
MTPEDRIIELGLTLPPAPKPLGSYLAAVRTGKLIFTAGQLPMRDGQLLAMGKVPTDVDVDAAQAPARQAALNALAAVAGEVGSLSAVRRIVRVNVFVNSAAGFTDQAIVANGASDFLADVFGEAGRHTRCVLP